MERNQLNRIALAVTILGCIYVFGVLTLQLGWVGLLGTGLSLVVIATAFALWSWIRSD